MKTIFCIDDTDILNSARGTGELADMLIREIEAKGWGRGGYIVRHQLFVHPDVPYTSHNSSMSFTLEVGCAGDFQEIISFAGKYLEKMSEIGSDPGLCAAEIDKLKEQELLISFGRDAKRKVISKEDAYGLAVRLGIHLSEHGGTGQGVIGALAGVGLRISGTDGRVRGKHLVDESDNILTAAEILGRSSIDLITDANGSEVGRDDRILLGAKVKSIYKNGKSVLLVCPYEGEEDAAKWQTCPMEYIKSITGM